MTFDTVHCLEDLRLPLLLMGLDFSSPFMAYQMTKTIWLTALADRFFILESPNPQPTSISSVCLPSLLCESSK